MLGDGVYTFKSWRAHNASIEQKGIGQLLVRKQLQRDKSVHSAMVLVIAE